MKQPVDMECGGQHVSKKKQKTLFRAFLEDFEKQQFDLSDKSKEELEVHKWTVGTLFTIDMLICYSIIGKYNLTVPDHKKTKVGNFETIFTFNMILCF